MLTRLANIIQKKPWFVVAVILFITIGFSIFLPSLEFKTNFGDFIPDDDLVKANTRVFRYFGSNKQVMIVLLEKENIDNLLTPNILRDIYFIEKELNNIPEINSTVSLTTLLNLVCFIEFGQNLDNCSDEQIQIALNDLLNEQQQEELIVLPIDDPNEPIDFKRYPVLSRGKNIDSADVKNIYISKDDSLITFSFEVYDLSTFSETLKPPFPKINVMEWYLEFENLIQPDERLDITYRIAAHIEPTYPIWELGGGLIHNLRQFFQHFRTRELFNSYKKEVYLWVQPPGQNTFFPLPLKKGNITFSPNENRINIVVSLEELRDYGIAPRFGEFELPAKLSDFKGGTRYYQVGIFNRPGGRITFNTKFLINRIEKLQTRPILGRIAARILQKTGDMTWEDFDTLFELMNQTAMTPETIALKDIDATWTMADNAPDTQSSNQIFFMYPYIFNEFQVNALSFLSKEFQQTNTASGSIIVLEFEYGSDFDETIGINKKIIDKLESLDEKLEYISIKTTGEGIISLEINEITSEANYFIAPAIFIIIIFILFINFRKPSYVALAMLTLSIATVWLFGTMALLGIAFNVIAVALTPLILGLGVDYSVHLFHNYRAELEKGSTPGEAIKRSVTEIGTAMFLAMLTTVIAFMSFLTASIPPVRDFGVLLALGVIYTFLTAITILAAFRYILDKKKPPEIKRQLKIYSVRNIMGTISQQILKHQKKILILMFLISLILGSQAILIRTGFDYYEFVPEDTPSIELYGKIADEFPYSSQDQEFILIEGNIATVATLKGIAKTHENIEDDTFVSRNPDGSVKTTSIYTLLQQAIKNNQTLISRFNIDETTGIPQSDADVKALFDYFYVDTIDTEVQQNMSSMNLNLLSYQMGSVLYRNKSRYEATVIRIYIDTTLQSREGDINEELAQLKQEFNDDIESYGNAKALATGNYIITHTITNNLTYSQIISTGISIILAAFVLIIAYRNPLLGLIAMIPVCISILWILGTMQFIGYSLNVLTVTVTSITIGIGIDYAIHATERFRLIADRTGDITKAVCETISHTGGALFIAALTTTAGFGILAFAPIPPQQQFGIILAITITYSFITSVLILPLVLVRWARWRKKRKGYIISPNPAVPSEQLDEFCEKIGKQ